jgi:NADH-quinone oxidoreductase subunit L
MDNLLMIYLVPLLFSLIFAGPYRFHEKTITRLSTLSLLLPALISIYLIGAAFSHHEFPLEKTLLRFSIFSHSFPVTIWIDKYSIGMLLLTHLLGLIVVKYSHGYLHLEKGYQRFFSTILFFIFGMYIISLAGTIDVFFAGWEIVGLSSFLLIAFYRSHPRSVQNAWRIYNIYRVCDVGLLIGAVMGHLLWHEASRFSVLLKLTSADFAGVHSTGLAVISFMVIFASLGKSAQFPFHSWPARAMEGPTPSSAIFYGALSIHAGVFLLIRTYPIWSHGQASKILVGVIGLLTFIFSTLQEKVQSNIKGQIAFANTANIGLMFIELSFGLVDLVMIHLFCHALYRCFQLLVSPSIVLNSLTINNEIVADRLAKNGKVSPTLYVLAMSDFSLDVSWRGLNFLSWKKIYWFFENALKKPLIILPLTAVLSYLIGLKFDLPLLLSFLAVIHSIRALVIDHDAFRSMGEMSLSILLMMGCAYLVDHHNLLGIKTYMFSTGPALLVGTLICAKFKNYDMRNYHALGTLNSAEANTFLVCFMVIAGMPISTAFVGEDILIEELISHSHLMAALMTLCLMVSGLVCVKIYTRLFMGRPMRETYHKRIG